MERKNTTKRINPKLGLNQSQDIDISMERKNTTKKINPKLGLKKSQDININMSKKQPKEFFPKLGLKKSQDVKSKKYIYKEPMSKEGPVFPILKRRNIKKKPTIIGKP